MNRWPRILVLVLGFGVLSPGLPGRADEDGDGAWAARVDRLVAERQPTADEKRFDTIGRARSLLDAQRLARESGRPGFLFNLFGCGSAALGSKRRRPS